MTKYREYSREFSPEQLDDLRNSYSDHLRLSRGGFLSDKQRKRLLRLKKKEQGTPDSDFWWRIKESTRDAMMDMKMICDIASEKELQEIFGTKQTRKQSDDMYPITKVLSSLLPSMLSEDILREGISNFRSSIESAKIDLKNQRNNPNEVKRLRAWIAKQEPRLKEQERNLPEQEEKLKEQEWRKFILEDLAVKCLTWYYKSGLFKTDSHRRMLIDTMDAITIMSSGLKKVDRRFLDDFSEVAY